MNHHHTFSCTLSFVLSLWGAKAFIKVISVFFCWLDGADVRCLPPRCGREPGLQEPGSHHYPRRGKGSGVKLFVNIFLQIESLSFAPYMTWNWPAALEGDMDCGVLMHHYVGCIVSVQYSLKNTRGSRHNFHLQAPKTDNWQHQHSELSRSISALSTVSSHIHLRHIKLFCRIILYTQNYLPIFVMENINLFGLCMFV